MGEHDNDNVDVRRRMMDDRRREHVWRNGNSVRIVSQSITLADTVACPVTVHFSQDYLNHDEPFPEEYVSYDWWTKINVPIHMDSEPIVKDLVLRPATHVTLSLGKLDYVPVLMMKLEGLAQLCGIYDGALLCARVHGHFGEYYFDHKMDALEIVDGTGEGEVVVDDDFLTNFEKEPTLHKSGIIGAFTISVFWEHFPLKDSTQLLSKLADSMVSQEIQELDGLVILKSGNGERTIKFSKGLLAACSPKYLGEFKSGMMEASSSGGNLFELEVYCTPDTALGERALLAFVQFIRGLSLKEPMASASVALELLMAGHYNLFPELETAMRSILLAQPPAWFDVPTTIKLFCYANKLYKMLEDGDDYDVVKPTWKQLMLKALWNLKGKSRQEIEECAKAENLFQVETIGEVVTLLLSLV